MPGMVAPVDDERELLLAYLAQQRRAVRLAAYGITDEQARTSPSASTLTLGGLVKHLARVERHWMDMVKQQQEPFGAVDEYAEGFQVRDDETLQRVFDEYDAVARDTERAVRSLPLEHSVPVPRDVPWFPTDVHAWSLRWVLLHLIEETARHAGHADIVRESLDGATAFPLMAAAEGWPATPWLQPWTPSSSMSVT